MNTILDRFWGSGLDFGLILEGFDRKNPVKVRKGRLKHVKMAKSFLRKKTSTMDQNQLQAFATVKRTEKHLMFAKAKARKRENKNEIQ